MFGSDDWVHVIATSGNGLDPNRQQRWTARTLGHPEVRFGVADRVAG